MNEFNFKPESDYAGLLKQANAMSLLIRTMEKTKTFQSLKIGDLCRELFLQGHEEINAQRETNNRLTNEIESLEHRLAATEAKLPRWIPVSERLPKPATMCLVIEEGDIEISYFTPASRWASETLYKRKVTNWMPLPEPPNNEENAG